jgi:putative ABC transport system permease protein
MNAFVNVRSRPEGAGPGLPLATRFALRELRGGVSGFWIFILCIALGVMAIAGVNSVRRAMQQTIAEEGRTILGADIAFSLVNRAATPPERAYLDTIGTVSEVTTLRAMARKGDGVDQALVEMKAVDDLYPLYGTLEIQGGGDPKAALGRQGNGPWGALVEAPLLVRLKLSIGDSVEIGTATLRIVGIVSREPDKVGGGLGFGPRVLLSEEALEATGLVQPGSLTRVSYRIRLAAPTDEAALDAIGKAADARFPQAAWEVRSRSNAAPGLKLSIDRFAEFLTLVGLTSLIVGGVGVANAVKAHLDGKRDVIATLKCLGATGGFVVTLYFVQILVLAGVGIAIGLVGGALAPMAAGWLLADLLPIGTRASIYPSELALAGAYGGLTAAAFALWPLGRAHDVPPTALFRDRAEPDRRWPQLFYLVLVGLMVSAIAALAIGLADDRLIALYYICGLAASFVLLRLVAIAVMAIARRSPHARSTELRLAVANLHRPGAATPSVVLSLGLGLTLLVTLALVDTGLRAQLRSQLPKDAPSFFFLDVPNRDISRFVAFLRETAPDATVSEVPMLRGRIVAANGVRADELKVSNRAGWVLSGDRGVTYSQTLPNNSVLAEGTWWPKDYAGSPLVSFDQELAGDLGFKIGDKLRVNVLGREVEVTIANFRKVRWESLGINFVMVFSPNTFRGAPHGFLATVAWPGGGTAEAEVNLIRAVTASFPIVTTIRVRDALKAVDDLVSQLANGASAAASVTLATSMLVLAGALAAGQRRRIYDAVILKTLGATRRRLLLTFGIEYGLLGLATAIFGLLAGSGAAWFVLVWVMNVGFVFDASVAFGAVVAAIAATLGFGLVDTARALGAKPASVLRHL